jgi:ParB family transcriptional regulator, chromosome partitioning protein
MTKRGLGRGLDALLPSSGRGDQFETREGLQHASIELIDPNPRQPRDRFDDEELDELSASIAELGVLQPLLVRAVSGRFELIAGERRLRASKKAGLSEVPVMVIETDDVGSLERALVENVHRSDLDPIEEAAAYKQLIEEAGITQEKLGTRLGRNRVTITNALRLLDLPIEIQSFLRERKLTAAHGRVLLGLQENPFQMRVAKRVADEKLSVRETDALVKRFLEMTGSIGSGPSGAKEPTPAAVGAAQHALADHLGSRVRVEFGKRKGKVVIDVVSVDDLERIVDLITGGDPTRPSVASPE